jgi:outer membrane protein assembly factor BamB
VLGFHFKGFTLIRHIAVAASLWSIFVAGCGSVAAGKTAREESASKDSTAGPIADRAGRPAEGSTREIAVGDWSQFLGPHGDGVSGETGLANAWPAGGPPQIWTKEIGVGYSAPSVLGDRLVVHHRLRNEEVIECVDANTGTSAWTHRTPTAFVDPYGYNGGPRCTPLLTQDRCYTYGASGTLCCVELATGNEIWRREVLKDFTVPEGFFGVGCTPVLYGNLLIALVGGQPDAAVVAFDKDTGKTVWHAGGKPTWDGVVTSEGEPYDWTGDETLISYSSPIIAKIAGEDHLLCLLRQGLLSLDPWTGKTQFRYWFRSQAHESVNAARPVVVGDDVLITAAYRTGAALLHVKTGGFDEVWRDRSNLECHWSTPIVVEGHAYGFSGRHENEGTLRCVEVATGKVLWTADGGEPVHDAIEPDPNGRGYVFKASSRPAPWPYYGRASMTLADGKFIILGERGTLFLSKLSPEGVKELARASAPGIRYPAWAAPVLSRGRLYLRDEDTLVCLDVSKKIQPK